MHPEPEKACRTTKQRTDTALAYASAGRERSVQRARASTLRTSTALQTPDNLLTLNEGTRRGRPRGLGMEALDSLSGTASPRRIRQPESNRQDEPQRRRASLRA